MDAMVLYRAARNITAETPRINRVTSIQNTRLLLPQTAAVRVIKIPSEAHMPMMKKTKREKLSVTKDDCSLIVCHTGLNLVFYIAEVG